MRIGKPQLSESLNVLRFALLGFCDALNSAGMARPPKDPLERLRPITIHLNPESVDLLDQHARSRGLTRGGLVASVLKRLTFVAPNTEKSADTPLKGPK